MKKNPKDFNLFLKHLGLRIKKARKSRQLTQEETAKLIGVDRRHYQRIEGGEVNLQVKSLLSIFWKLNIWDRPFWTEVDPDDHNDDSVCLLDGKGNITFVDDGWLKFARENDSSIENFIGLNYIDEWHRASMDVVVEGDPIDAIFNRIVNGEGTSGSVEYMCHSPVENRRFRVTFYALRHSRSDLSILVTHYRIK